MAHPSIEHVLQFFDEQGVPENGLSLAQCYRDLAQDIVEEGLSNPEVTLALRDLLASRDNLMRALRTLPKT